LGVRDLAGSTRVEVEPEEHRDEHDGHHQCVLQQCQTALGQKPGLGRLILGVIAVAM